MQVHPGCSSTRVLIVDDDHGICLALARCFSPWFVVSTAGSAREALSLLARQHFDAVITDCNMPGMSGIELLRATRSQYPRVLRFLMSGWQPNDIWEQHASGLVQGFFHKPVQIELVMTALGLDTGEHRGG